MTRLLSHPVHTVRTGLRSRFYDVLRKGLVTHDGKSIVAESLRGLLADEPSVAPQLINERAPYEDLGNAPPNETRLRDDIVFVTGRFRSGSTLVWNLFRNLPDCTAYYEPFNERRWFDASARGERVDGTHLGVSDYWREYEGLDELGEWYREEWIDSRLYLEPGTWMPEMGRFLDRMIGRASGRPVLQFNRLDFRLPWIRRRFPNARILHVHRHPRDQWCSSLVDPSSFPPNGTMADFAAHDHFYLLHWARDLSFHFPFLDPATATHPYELFYAIWKLSYLFGRTFADHTLRFESLVADPRTEIATTLEALGFDPTHVEPLLPLVEQPSLGKWRDYADDGWFRAIEEGVEAAIDEFLATQR